MTHPTDEQIRTMLAGLSRGDHLALHWPAPAGVPVRQCVVFYLRVSSVMQLGGQSLDDQWLACRRYAEQLSLACVGLYVDPAVSGRKEHRPAIDALLGDLLEAEARAAAAEDRRIAPVTDRAALAARLERLGEVYADGLLSREKYQQQRMAIQAQLDAADPQQPTEPDLATVLALLRDVPALIREAGREEARAIVAPMLARVWVEQGQLVAITPTAAFRPLFVALWNAYEVTMGCPTGFEPPLLTPLWDDARTRLAA